MEARSLDPQQAFVLHGGYAALLGYLGMEQPPRETLKYAEVGVYVGVEASGLMMQDTRNAFSASGCAVSITSGRLSFALGLIGPCYSIDTACSSTLVAIHTCTNALKGSECTSGVGAGTKVLSEAFSLQTAVAGMTSLFGRCHTFDTRADGYCRGEGSGAFILVSGRAC